MSTTATFLDAATISCEPVKPGCVDSWTVHQHSSAGQVAERIRGCQVVFTNKARIGAAELAAAPDLKLVVVAATGYDIIDLEACRARSVAVANSPGYSASSVVEHAVALMFCVARSIVPLQREAADGTWSSSPIFCLHTHPIVELAGKSVGLVGSGSLGRATGELCQRLGMRTAYLKSSSGKGDDLRRLGLEELLASSDFVSLHCPLSEDNRHMINRDTLAMMKPSAILVNTARGALVDPHALVAALEAGRLGGAGIDVVDPEPPRTDHPLVACRHPALVVTPHVAWASMEVQQRLAAMIAATADAFFAGRPVHLVSR